MGGVIAVHHVETGPPDAPVLVLSNAIGTDLSMWDPQVARLGEHFRVVRYDQRGHGRSPVPKGPYDIGDLGRDLVGLLDELGVGRASICGLSLGAMTALWVAAHAPERVDRVVACCVVDRPLSPESWVDRANRARAGGTASIGDLVVERWGYVDRDPALAALVRDLLTRTVPEGYAGCCEAIAALDLGPDLEAIQAPTLLLAGSDDPAAPPAAVRGIGARIKGSRVRVVSGAAHLLNVERPSETTGMILEHLLEPVAKEEP